MVADRKRLDSIDWAGFQQALEAALSGEVTFDRVIRSMHATDASVYQIMPVAVVTPRDTNDVTSALSICREYGVSITARGGGTSQAGQAIGAGIVMDFSRHMNRLLSLDVEAKTVDVEPGIVLDELNAALKPHGLQLPLDLSTANRATIGGMIANNSAGTRSVIYGKTLDYVEALDVLLADGSIVRMEELTETATQKKLAQNDLEGTIYRTVTGLAAQHEEEIEQRYPKILRRVGGYNLDEFVPSARPLNLAKIMVGSEGTLALTLRARLRLVPLPEARIVCSVQFENVLEAMAATPYILEHNPSAVELIDRFILDTTRGRLEFEPLRAFIHGDPGAILIVEFFGDGDESLTESVDRLVADLDERELGHHIYRAVESADQARIWSLRRAALGLTMSEKGNDAKGISFVEDTAVPPVHLHDYIENFQQVLARHETQAGFYAHASVGLLHVRPIIDMKSPLGVERFSAIAKEVSDLVLEYGGALSGEHGDGLVRGPFQEKMFGSTLYSAFRQIKSTFDPIHLLNPGKIVDAPALQSNLRYGGDYVTPEFETIFDFSDYGGLLRAAEQCSGVGACRKTRSGTMCPSYMATQREIDSTRGRANALRQALSGQLDLTGLTMAELKPVMELCLECKACKTECPTGVDMARLKSEFQHHYRKRHGTSAGSALMAHIAQLSPWGSRLAPIVNRLTRFKAIRQLNQQLFGIDARRPLPLFARQSFTSTWSASRSRAPGKLERTLLHTGQTRDTSPSSDDIGSSTVVLFADTFNNYLEPQNLTASVRLLESMGCRVILAPRVCCGRPLISKGYLAKAVQQASAMTAALLPFANRGLPILFLEPSCYSAIVDDHPLLLRGDSQKDAQQVAQACLLLDQWVAENEKMPPLRSGPRRIVVHGHCHQKVLTGLDPMLKMLSHIPNCEIEALDSGCCGMAGSFGYEQYDVSQAIGERRLLPAARQLNADEILIASGYSCRQQVKQLANVEALAPVALVSDLLGEVAQSE